MTKRGKATRKRGTKGLRSGPIGDREDRRAVQKTFLKAFAETGVVLYAAEIANITRKTHYDWLQLDSEYKEAFQEAEEDAADVLEAEARRRAVEGVEVPVGFYKGEASQYVRRFSDGLLKFLLEGRRRQVFGRRTELAGPGSEGQAPVVTKIEHVIVDPADG